MTDAPAPIPLRTLLKRSAETIQIDPLTEYQEITVRLWGKGVIRRGYVNGSELADGKRFVARSGQFILSRIDARHGANGLIPPELDGAIVTNDFPLFDVDRSRLDPAYLKWLGRTPNFVQLCLRASEGTTNRVRLAEDRFLSLSIALPSIGEQRRLVRRIEELADKTVEISAIRDRAVEQLTSFWPAFLNDALRGQLVSRRADDGSAQTILEALVNRPTNFVESKANNAHPNDPTVIANGPYALPEGWLWVTLSSVLSHLIDCVNDTPEFAAYDTGFVGLKSTNIRPYFLDLQQRWFVTEADFHRWNRRAIPQAGDIVLTREAPVGYACQLPEGLRVCLTQRLMLLRPAANAILPELLLHYLNSSVFSDQVLERARGLTTPHIRVQDAPDFLVPLPPMPQQHRIVAEIRSMHSKVSGIKSLQATSQAEMNALLPAILDRAFRAGL